jgi:hypothetical protein
MAVMVSPVAISGSVVSSNYDWRRAIHHRWRGHNHWRWIHHSRWGSHNHWCGVDRYPNTNGYPYLCLCRERQGKGGETEYSDNDKHAEKCFGALHAFYPLVVADRHSVFLLYISVLALLMCGCRGGHTVPVRLGTVHFYLYR